MDDLIDEVSRALRARGWSAQHASRQLGGSPEFIRNLRNGMGSRRSGGVGSDAPGVHAGPRVDRAGAARGVARACSGPAQVRGDGLGGTQSASENLVPAARASARGKVTLVGAARVQVRDVVAAVGRPIARGRTGPGQGTGMRWLRGRAIPIRALWTVSGKGRTRSTFAASFLPRASALRGAEGARRAARAGWVSPLHGAAWYRRPARGHDRSSAG